MAKKKKSDMIAEFDGREVIQTSIAITNAGDGLSAALAVDPAMLHMGDTVYVVLECQVAKGVLGPVNGDYANLELVHKLKAGAATLVDRDLVVEQLETQTERIRLAKEEEDGVRRMFDKGEDQLLQEHGDGDHPEPVPNCLACVEQYGEPEPDIPAEPEAI